MEGLDVRNILSLNVKKLRENRKMSQADLAFEAGISIPFLSDIERGNKWPSPDTLAKVATVFNVELFELFVPGAGNAGNRELVAKIVKEMQRAQESAAETVYNSYFGTE